MNYTRGSISTARLCSFATHLLFFAYFVRAPLPCYCRYSTGREADHPEYRPLQGPRSVKEAQARPRPDMLISAHQENYMDLNAGFYFVRGNERTRKLFQVWCERVC